MAPLAVVVTYVFSDAKGGRGVGASRKSAAYIYVSRVSFDHENGGRGRFAHSSQNSDSCCDRQHEKERQRRVLQILMEDPEQPLRQAKKGFHGSGCQWVKATGCETAK